VSLLNHSHTRRWVGIVSALGLAFAMASPASASPETLKRSLGNIIFAPLDIVLAPAAAGKIIYTNMREIEDSQWVRIVYPIPGFVWVTGVTIGGGILREVSGLLELLPGIGLAFMEADLDPIFAPVERGEALVDVETVAINVKFGMNYTAVPY
jgi:hypothetical protein